MKKVDAKERGRGGENENENENECWLHMFVGRSSAVLSCLDVLYSLLALLARSYSPNPQSKNKNKLKL